MFGGKQASDERIEKSKTAPSCRTASCSGSGVHMSGTVFTRICKWLNVSPDIFFIESEGNARSTGYSLAQILDLVRSDAALTPSAANVLSALVRAAYQISQPTNPDT